MLVSKKVNKRFFDVESATPALVNNHIRGYWSAFPVFDLRFGLDYLTPIDMNCLSSCLGCFTFDLGIGYEVFSFIGGIDRPFYTSSLFTSGAYMNEHMNFTFHGPYVHIGVTF